MRGLENKVILIAGGAGGPAAATAIRRASEGAKVVIGDFKLPAAEELVAQIRSSGGVAEAFRLDIGTEASVREFIKFGVEKFGGIDGLHANAAILGEPFRDVDILNVDMDFWDQVFQVNLKGY